MVTRLPIVPFAQKVCSDSVSIRASAEKLLITARDMASLGPSIAGAHTGAQRIGRGRVFLLRALKPLPAGSRFPFHPRLHRQASWFPIPLGGCGASIRGNIPAASITVPRSTCRGHRITSGEPVSCLAGPLLRRLAPSDSIYALEPSKLGAARLLNCLYGIGAQRWTPHCG